MGRAELEALARAWVSLWCAPVDWALFERLHAEDFEDASPAGRGSGRAAYAEGLREFIAAFPDLVTRVEGLVIDETAQRVAVRWSAVGSNRQRFLGVGPTGRRTAIAGIEIIELADGRIVRRWGEWDISAHTCAAQ